MKTASKILILSALICWIGGYNIWRIFDYSSICFISQSFAFLLLAIAFRIEFRSCLITALMYISIGNFIDEITYTANIFKVKEIYATIIAVNYLLLLNFIKNVRQNRRS